MKVLIFGATGMVGQGVLRECLLDSGVEVVQTVGRTATGVQHPKLREVVQPDLWDYSSIESELSGFDTCFFALGVSAAGIAEADYAHITYGITTAAAGTLSRINPQMTFIYVSGAGTDSSEKGRMMWARVKGRTENALLRLPFRAAYMFRPGLIQPLNRIHSRTTAYKLLYALLKPLLPVLRGAFPNSILTTQEIGRAMLEVARNGTAKRILESKDIHAIAHT